MNVDVQTVMARLATIGSSGRYTLSRALGEGGFGFVFQADERGPDGAVLRQVAIKLIPTNRDMDRKRLGAREVAILGQCNHPGIITLLAWGQGEDPVVGEYLYFVMPVATQSLRAMLRRSVDGLHPRLALSFAQEIIGALAYLHEAQLVHRDVKPENILRYGDSVLGHWTIADFGLCDSSSASGYPTGPAVAGTPLYMAPESLQAGASPLEVNPSLDVWAFGVVLHEVLCGQLPFAGTREADWMDALKQGEVSVSSSITPSLARIVRGCLQPELQHRWTVAQVSDQLRNEVVQEQAQAALRPRSRIIAF